MNGRRTRCATSGAASRSHRSASAGLTSLGRVPPAMISTSLHSSSANSARAAKKKSNLSSSRSSSASSQAPRSVPPPCRAMESSASSAMARTSSTCTALLRYTAATRCWSAAMPHTVSGPPAKQVSTPELTRSCSVRRTVERSVRSDAAATGHPRLLRYRASGATVAQTSSSVSARSAPSMATQTAAVAVTGVVRLMRWQTSSATRSTSCPSSTPSAR